MEKLQILMIGRDPVVLQKLLRFVNENPKWQGTGTIDDTSAKTVFNQQAYPLVVLVDEIGTESEMEIRQQFALKSPSVAFLHHYGDSTGLLASEIQDYIQSGKVQMSQATPEQTD